MSGNIIMDIDLIVENSKLSPTETRSKAEKDVKYKNKKIKEYEQTIQKSG